MTKQEFLAFKNGTTIGHSTANESKPTVIGSALLPVIGQIVAADVKLTRNWPICLGGLKISYKKMLVKRIRCTSNSKGWQWSGANSDTFINGDIVSWHCR